jgi:hypothetical protein
MVKGMEGDFLKGRIKFKFGPRWHRAVLKTRLVFLATYFATVPSVRYILGSKTRAEKTIGNLVIVTSPVP